MKCEHAGIYLMRKISLILMLISCSAFSAVPIDARPPGITGETWQFGPVNRWAFVHLREILPTKNIPNLPSAVSVIPGLDEASDDLLINLNSKSVKLSDVMGRLFVDGILVINDGKAVVERYGGYLTPDKAHILWSVSKMITGLTAGSVFRDGLIDLEKTESRVTLEL